MTAIATLESLPDGAAKGVTIELDGQKHELILVRRGARVFAYLNACPHLGTPLETFPNKFLDYSGTRLMCSTHGASFRIEDGYCLRGPCVGRSLTPAPVELRGSKIVLTGAVPKIPAPMP